MMVAVTKKCSRTTNTLTGGVFWPLLLKYCEKENYEEQYAGRRVSLFPHDSF
jgi:hypothetical protein